MNIKSNHQLWLNQYEEIQRSGLSIRSWAIQNNLSSSSISKRIYRLRQMGLIPEGAKHKLLDGVNVPAVVL